jgi:hypothetical protein
VSRWLLLVNALLAGVAVFFAVSLVRDLTHSRPLPAPPPPRRAAGSAAAEAPTESPVAAEKLANYNVIVAKHLFNPTRTEGGSGPTGPPAPAAPPPPKPLLLGVVVDGQRSRAYLEDPATKRVFGYQIGDTVAGGRLEKISDDKVVIVRTDGPVDVMLRDPSKPKAVAGPATPTVRGGPPAPPGAAPQPPGASMQNPPAAPGRAPVPPRAIRRVPIEGNQESQ